MVQSQKEPGIRERPKTRRNKRKRNFERLFTFNFQNMINKNRFGGFCFGAISFKCYNATGFSSMDILRRIFESERWSSCLWSFDFVRDWHDAHAHSSWSVEIFWRGKCSSDFFALSFSVRVFGILLKWSRQFCCGWQWFLSFIFTTIGKKWPRDVFSRPFVWPLLVFWPSFGRMFSRFFSSRVLWGIPFLFFFFPFITMSLRHAWSS